MGAIIYLKDLVKIGKLINKPIKHKNMKRISTIIKGLAKVRNMTSSSGNDIANQFIINTNDATIFQSYSSIIAIKTGGQTILDSYYWDYSTTTGKYRNIFLGMNKKETEQLIKSGSIKLADLNK